MIDTESSSRLALLRFPLIVGVVFIHMYGSLVGFTRTVGKVEYGPVSSLVQNLLSEGLARTAVPLFFLIAGYFYFLNFKWSSAGYLNRLSSRAKSLLVPFIIWNIFTLAVYALVQSIPFIQSYLSGKGARISEFTPFDYLNAVFGINRSPISFQFWFIRDLIVLVILSPILYFAIGKFRVIFGMILAVSWLAGVWPFYSPSADATLFFTAGGMVANSQNSLFSLDRWRWVAYPSYIALLVAEALCFDMPWSPYLHRVQIVAGVLTILCLSKAINNIEKIRRTLISLSGASFFVFAAHEPILSIFKKIAYGIFHPNSDASFLFIYFMVPIVLITSLVFSYRRGVLFIPGFMKTITGGR